MEIVKIIVELISTAFENDIEHWRQQWRDKKRLASFLAETEQWCDAYISAHDGTVLSSGEFASFIERYAVVDHIVKFCSGTASCTEEELLERETTCAKDAFAKPLTPTDLSILKSFLKDLFTRIDLYFKDQVPAENRALLSTDGRIQAGLQSINKKLDQLQFVQTKDGVCESAQVARLSYSFDQPYITRKYATFQDLNGPFWILSGRSFDDLLKLCLEKRHVVLLGEAGCGKSIELRRLAARVSDEQKNFYPLFVDLSQYVDQDLLEWIEKEYKGLDYNCLFLIFDAFDEVKATRQNDFARRLNEFTARWPKAIIVISCRNNFYSFSSEEGAGTFNSFAEYGICPISRQDIYDSFQANSLDADRNIQELEEQNLLSMASNPFYLSILVEIAKEGKGFPARSDVMRVCIEKRFRFDQTKYVNTEDLRKQKVLLIELIEKVAFSMQCLQQVSINNETYQRLFSIEERELINYSGIFSQKASFAWQFEHNNFREFLAADYLNHLCSVEDIKGIISISNGKIKESWVNTLSFLVTLDIGESLQEWLYTADPEMLVKFEQSRVPDSIRNDVVIRILNDLESSDLWLTYGKNSAYELARFGQSPEMFSFLLSKMQAAVNERAVTNAIRVLSEFSSLFGQKERVREALFSYIQNKDISDGEKTIAIDAITKLKLWDKTITSFLLKEYDPKQRSSFRSAVLLYFLENGEFEKHIDLYITQSERNHRWDEGDEEESGTLHILVERAFQLSRNTETLCKILEHYGKHRLGGYPSDQKVLIEVIQHCIAGYCAGNHDLFKAAFGAFSECCKRADWNTCQDIFPFFVKTETLAKAFELAMELYAEDQWDSLILIEYLLRQRDDEGICESALLNQYKKDPARWEGLCKRLYARSRPGEKIALKIQQALEDNNVTIEHLKNVDYEAIRREGEQIFFDSLFRKEDFLKLVAELVCELGDLEIRCGQPIEKAPDFSTAGARKNALRHIVFVLNRWQIDEVRLSELESAIKNWEWLLVDSIYHELKNHKDITVSEEQQGHLYDVCLRYSQETDYSVKSTPEAPNRFSHSYQLLYLTFLSVRFDFNYDKSIYQKMLLSDPRLFYKDDEHNGFPEYLKKRLSSDFKSTVISNLPEVDAYCSCASAYLMYCREQHIEDAVDLANSICETGPISSIEKREAVQYLYEICGSKYIFDKYLGNKDDKDLLEQIVQITRESKSEKLIQRLLEENERSENKLIYLKDLIIMGSHDGVDRYISLCKERNAIPDYTESDTISELTEAISTLKAADFLVELSEMRKLIFTPGFKDRSFFGLSNSVFKAYKNVEGEGVEKVKAELSRAAEETGSPEEKRYCNAVISDLAGMEERQEDVPWTIRQIQAFWRNNASTS